MLREKGAHPVSKLAIQGTMEVLRSPVVAGHLIHKLVKVFHTSPGVRPAGPPRRLPSRCQPFQRGPQLPLQLGLLLPLQVILQQLPLQLCLLGCGLKKKAAQAIHDADAEQRWKEVLGRTRAPREPRKVPVPHGRQERDTHLLLPLLVRGDPLLPLSLLVDLLGCSL